MQASQIRKWKKEESRLRLKSNINPNANSVHAGRKVDNRDFEQLIYDWIVKQRNAELAVSTSAIIAKALSMDGSFKDGCEKKLRYWVYPFLSRWNLSCRMATRTGQRLNGHLLSVRQSFSEGIRTQFLEGGQYCDVPPDMFVNMDETAVYFEAKENRTVHFKGENTISIRSTGSNSKRLSVCVAVSSNGCKLPLFFIFKGQPNGRIEKALSDVLPPNTFGCCQSKGWMDQRSMKIWFEKVWKQYVANSSKSVLLLDDFICHKQPEFLDLASEVGTSIELIPGGYTCVLQPCDVGIMKSLKGGIRQCYTKWAAQNLCGLPSDQSIPTPDRKDVSEWISRVFHTISSECITATFSHIGFLPEHESPPLTPFPLTPFPYFDDHDGEVISYEDVVHVLGE